jgi:hypothetical protein
MRGTKGLRKAGGWGEERDEGREEHGGDGAAHPAEPSPSNRTRSNTRAQHAAPYAMLETRGRTEQGGRAPIGHGTALGNSGAAGVGVGVGAGNAGMGLVLGERAGSGKKGGEDGSCMQWADEYAAAAEAVSALGLLQHGRVRHIRFSMYIGRIRGHGGYRAGKEGQGRFMQSSLRSDAPGVRPN